MVEPSHPPETRRTLRGRHSIARPRRSRQKPWRPHQLPHHRRTASTVEDKRGEHNFPTAVRRAATRSRRHRHRTRRSEFWETRSAHHGSRCSATCPPPAIPGDATAPLDLAATAAGRSHHRTLTPFSSRSPRPQTRRVAAVPHRDSVAICTELPHRAGHPHHS
jgi:hypothetical protein